MVALPWQPQCDIGLGDFTANIEISCRYYCLSLQLEAAGPLGLLLRPLLPLLSFRLCGSAAHQVAMKWLKRHWQVLLQRHAARPAPAAAAASPGTPLGFPSCSPKPCEEPPATPQGRDSRAANGLSITTEGHTDMDSAQNSPMDAEVLLPSSKGMPFHNGFLYKLGDGILNTTWNLRYFLLIGQTLQYYRSQHEARPRDAINLSGVTVEWLRDQSRPFSFTVSKSGARSYCLSGCTEQEASEWMERIQAASKINTSVTTPSSRRQYHASPSDLPELAQPAASTWQEAKMKECSQETAVLSALRNCAGALSDLIEVGGGGPFGTGGTGVSAEPKNDEVGRSPLKEKEEEDKEEPPAEEKPKKVEKKDKKTKPVVKEKKKKPKKKDQPKKERSRSRSPRRRSPEIGERRPSGGETALRSSGSRPSREEERRRSRSRSRTDRRDDRRREEKREENPDTEVWRDPGRFGLNHIPIRGSAGRHHGTIPAGSQKPAEPRGPPPRDSRREERSYNDRSQLRGRYPVNASKKWKGYNHIQRGIDYWQRRKRQSR
eukprot:s1259_g2.t1